MIVYQHPSLILDIWHVVSQTNRQLRSSVLWGVAVGSCVSPVAPIYVSDISPVMPSATRSIELDRMKCGTNSTTILFLLYIYIRNYRI